MLMAQQYSRYMHILVLKSQMIKHQMNSKVITDKERHGNHFGKTLKVDFFKLSG